MKVPTMEFTSKLKRWWTKELSQLWVQANKLGRNVYKLRSDPMHQVHNEHKAAKGKYQKALKHTKQQH